MIFAEHCVAYPAHGSGMIATLFEAQFRKAAEALEAAVLEKVCGEPIYQIAFSDEDGWCDTHKKCYDEHPEHMRRIVYALTRSKP